MENPILAEVTRGNTVESRHRGAAIVVDADGAVVFSVGDVERPVFPRSAVKSIQGLPLIESGAADRYGLTEPELALAISSHSGQPEHVETALGMLRKAGRDAGCLECGAHWPTNEKVARALAKSGAEPTALNNNCSGKHAGFVCLSCALDEDPSGYVKADHAVQQAVRGALEEVTGAPHTAEHRGTDGCSIPSYAIPLKALALGFARMGTGHGFGPERAKAAARFRAAAAAHPFMVAGTDRFDTRLMSLLGTRAFTKTGAEGVYCAALPELGYGIALKCDDGAGRAAEVALAALIARFLPMDDATSAAFAPLRESVLKNWNGIEVGRVRSPASA
ncbi:MULTISPECIES: asparaginase [unclassified Bosea (in: a-proteobacteria)]|uniref:asparaginase n=1 Tax=unclassified Bosea (in: a-proteobacteria) TaxID=2653178 RepID=UPI000954DA2C|nr:MULTISPECIES: asparaginase [unclassified Bosea (in: a-proteobacteria)]TAJ34214.1 MAG: asparaginase [Bosea sp. (in: a-proteobacteria)]SIQ02431.1 asparaginase [Bosea sp. TND4EK4]